ncbi:cytochrome P450 2F3-like isoform X2 [Apteryx mantelli]|uniref:Cytochrome P450 2F3-like isoform X2 n=1 Tax=Apteryx mantelli TaxID=2696672 RepID=A0ABM4G0B8_9AVES
MEASGALSTALALGASGLLLLLWAWRMRRPGAKLPPGPMPLPFLGNLLQVEVRELIGSLRKLSGTYGPIFTVHLGSRPCVVLSGYRVLKEALVDRAEEFSGRGDFPAVQQWSRGNGIVYGTGERWRQLRRFAIGTFKNFGMGKRSMEERVREEAQHLLQHLRQTRGEPFDPTFLLSCAGSNIICTLVFGERFEYTDRRFLSLMGLINTNWKLMSSTWGQIYSNYLQLAEFVGERVRRNRETLDPENPRDFIDCFLLKMQQEKHNPDTHFTEDTLSKTTVNLFFAGTETVSSTMKYGLRILLRHPEVEARLHEEIDRVIGRHRGPRMEDRSRMPYTDAVIHEIQRFADIVPMGVPHTATRDVQLRGYTIPKDMNVIPLLCTSQFDPSQFANPEAFDPGHFLDEAGRFKRNEAFMAFSAGKRVCLGEGLAMMELFIFLTSILQHFQLRAEGNPADIDITPESSGLGNIPRPYRLALVPR